MSLFSTSSAEATRNLRETPGARWHKADAEPAEAEQLACRRIGRGWFLPAIAPGFKIGRDDRIFAIGSCFARGIEKGMQGMGLRVESAAAEFDSFELSRPGVTPLGFTNKYTAFTTLNDLRWALEPGCEYPDAGYVALGDGTWADLQTNPTLKYADLATTRARRVLINRVNARVAQCRVVVLTLGLVEAWHDTLTGLYTNMAPLPAMLREQPGRFRFEVTDYDQNRDALESVHALLAAHGHPQTQIVVTVSPVPLMATFAGRDVAVANAHSKALLRALAEEFATRHENAHYFPSYEIATLSDPALVWEEDLRHVKGPATQTIIRWFLQHYLEG